MVWGANPNVGACGVCFTSAPALGKKHFPFILYQCHTKNLRSAKKKWGRGRSPQPPSAAYVWLRPPTIHVYVGGGPSQGFLLVLATARPRQCASAADAEGAIAPQRGHGVGLGGLPGPA